MKLAESQIQKRAPDRLPRSLLSIRRITSLEQDRVGRRRKGVNRAIPELRTAAGKQRNAHENCEGDKLTSPALGLSGGSFHSLRLLRSKYNTRTNSRTHGMFHSSWASAAFQTVRDLQRMAGKLPAAVRARLLGGDAVRIGEPWKTDG